MECRIRVPVILAVHDNDNDIDNNDREAMGRSASVLAHDESEGRPSVEAVPDDLRAQVAAGQCVAIRGESGNM